MIRTPNDPLYKAKDCGYVPQKLGFDNRRPFSMGLNSQNEQKTEDSPFKMADTEYWYKINGKTTTKAAYNAYKNKPGGDEAGKSTNDPDASGNKAKIKKDRAKNNKPTPKKSTESAHGQLSDAEMEYQEDLKNNKKAPLKQKVGFKPHTMYKKGKKSVKANTHAKHLSLKKNGYGHSPLKWGWKDTLDAAQTGLTGLGMIPGVGNLADGLNTAVSGGRAGYAALTGNKKDAAKYRNEALMNAAMMVPGAGQLVAGTKLAKGTLKGYKAVKNSNKVINKTLAATEKGVKTVNKVYKGNTKSKNTIGVIGDPKNKKNMSTYYNVVSGKTVAKGNKAASGEGKIKERIAETKANNQKNKNNRGIVIRKGNKTINKA